MPTLPLSESGFITLNASGAGTVKIGPTAHGVVWKPSRIGIKTSTAVKSPICQVFIGTSPTADNFSDGTFTGQQNNSDACVGQEVRLGSYVWAVWTGGDIGAQATVTVTGSKDIG
jgi:hypothetical protein